MNWTITTETYKRRSFMLLSHTLRTQTTRYKSHSNWNHTKCTQTHWITLFYTLLNTRTHFRTHFNTLWITIELLNSGKYVGASNCLLFFHLYLSRAIVSSIKQYFLHFEFQIINRFIPIQNNNFLEDDNTCHISFQIVNKPLLNSFSRSNCL